MVTSVKRKSSSKIDRPVDPAIAAQAKALVPLYQVVIGFDQELGCYSGRGAELPSALGFGDTPESCINEVRGNMHALVVHMLETGETPPLMGNPQRTAQVNIRLTDYEKSLIESLAKSAGQSASDYIRNVVLGRRSA